MAGRAEIRDVILGAAEGATGGVALLRDAAPEARLEDFDVEVTLDPNGGGEPGLSATIRFSIVMGSAESSAGGPPAGM